MKTGLAVPAGKATHRLITYALNHATEEELATVVTAVKQLPIIDGRFNEMYGPNCKKVEWPVGNKIDRRI